MPFNSVELSMTSELDPSLLAIVADYFPPDWRPASAHYRYAEHPRWPTFLVPVATIEPPSLEVESTQSFRDRVRSLARGIAEGVPLPPIGVGVRPRSSQYLLRVSEGALRFQLCRDLQFPQIPAFFSDES